MSTIVLPSKYISHKITKIKTDTLAATVYAGYLRNEYNSQFFKKRRHNILSKEDINSIKESIKLNKLTSRYKLSTKKKGDLRIINSIENSHAVKIFNDKIVFNSNSIVGKITISNNRALPDGYYKGYFIEVDSCPVLVVYNRTFKKIKSKDVVQRIKSKKIDEVLSLSQDRRRKFAISNLINNNKDNIQTSIKEKIEKLKKEVKVPTRNKIVIKTSIKSDNRYYFNQQRNLYSILKSIISIDPYVYSVCKARNENTIKFINSYDENQVGMKKSLPNFIKEEIYTVLNYKDPYIMNTIEDILNYDSDEEGKLLNILKNI